MKKMEIFVMTGWTFRDYVSLVFFPARIIGAVVFGWWPRKGGGWTSGF